MKQLNWYQIFGNTKQIPDGRTVTPTDDIQIWLHCADIWDKNYTTLYEVLNDTATLSALMASDNAVDYLVRSTSWAVPISVPTMTSNTEPSGICLCDSNISGEEAYKAFDKNNSTYWESNVIGTTGGQWLGYKFSTPQIISYLINRSSAGATNYVKVQYSDDDVNWVDTGDTYNIKNSDGDKKVSLTVDSAHYSYRIYCTSASSTTRLATTELNFYSPSISESADAMSLIGANDYAAETLLSDATWNEAIQNSEYFESVDNVKVPTMTSDTTPSGVASDDSHNSGAEAYHAFDGTSSPYSSASGVVSNIRLKYMFPYSVTIRRADIERAAWTYYPTAKIQGSNDGNTWEDLISPAFAIPGGATTVKLIDGEANYKYFALYFTASTGSYCNITELQFYGRQIGGVQTWLRAAGITDKLYTTLSEVLADSTTLTALMSSHSAVDYLVTAKGWADDICADSGAMTAIGNDNYCANTLLADETWLEAISGSTYKESVLNVKNPTMTDNTHPSGEAFAISVYNNRSDLQPWKVFDNSGSTQWASGSGDVVGAYVGYKFTSSVKVVMATLTIPSPGSANNIKKFKIQGYDGENWNDVSNEFTVVTSVSNYLFTNTTSNEWYRVYVTEAVSGSTNINLAEVQFYGREDV